MSNNHKYPYEAQQKINDLERKLEASRQEVERLRGIVDECLGRSNDGNFKDWVTRKLTTKSKGGEK